MFSIITIRLDPQSRGRAERLWTSLGSMAILFPALYMTVTGWGSGEHANIPITVGLVASAVTGAVWRLVWLALGRVSLPKRRRMFGVGAPLSLGGSIAALAATPSSVAPYTRLAWAVLAYVLIVASAGWVTRKSGV